MPSCAVRNVISDRLSRENDKYQMSSRKDFRIFSLYNILLQKGLATFVWFASRSRCVEIDGLQGLFFEKHGTLFTSTDANHPGGGGNPSHFRSAANDVYRSWRGEAGKSASSHESSWSVNGVGRRSTIPRPPSRAPFRGQTIYKCISGPIKKNPYYLSLAR